MLSTPTPFYRNLLPLAALLLFSAIAFILWHDQNRHERELALRHVQTSAEQLRVRVVGLMNARIASLQLLAERWVERQPPDFSRERFIGFASIMTKHYPGFAGMHWIDPSGTIRWTFPLEKESIEDKDISAYLDLRSSSLLDRIDRDTGYLATPAVDLPGRSKGFHVIIPLIHDGVLQGYLDGVFEVDRIMSLSLPDSMLRDLCIEIHEEDRLVFHSGGAQCSAWVGQASVGATEDIRFGGKTWKLAMEPTLTVYRAGAVGNLVLLAFGLALSAALSLLLYFLLVRMEMYRKSRDQALHEISQRKRMEETLREHEKKLEALLSELAAKNIELESFVYTVSHDLKTPIVTIEGFIGAFREDLGDTLSESGEKYLKYMSDATRKMEVLINDLLNLSRIGRTAERKYEFPLAESVRDAVDMLHLQIETRGIAVDIQENLPVVYGERKRLGQVMDNLLANAVKYIGKDNPDPRIEVGSEERNGERIFFVRDNGIGIEKRYFSKVFQIFERLPAAKQAGEGTGMGLTIVKRIIEHHGGRIWLESEPGRGTTFYFTLREKED